MCIIYQRVYKTTEACFQFLAKKKRYLRDKDILCEKILLQPENLK